ncbi:MAG: diguanylate cyclase [Actinomycetales bacterium]|nr:diguanylate cyclase [Actinomycetales bacterium]
MVREPDRVVLAVLTGFDAYQTALLRGACEVFDLQGISVLAYGNCPNSVEKLPLGQRDVVPGSLTCFIRHRRPLGVLVTNSLSPVQERELDLMISSSGIPAVYIGQDVPGRTCVRADNRQGMTALMAHLLDECGARRPAMVRGLSHQPDHVIREAIFREEVAARGIVPDEGLIIEGMSEREITLTAVRDLLRERRDLDAVVTTDDWCALAVVDALAGAGLQVPEDVAVTGFDNYPVATLYWPGVTTVDQNLETQGATAARALLDEIAGGEPAGQMLTPCRLVVRGSTARAGTTTPPEPLTVDTVARIARTHLAIHSGIRRLGRALEECRSVEDASAALVTSLPMLGVRRCFLVVHDDARGGAEADLEEHHESRLVLDYRDGRSHPVPEGGFSSCRLLPPYLDDELHRGFLGYQPLDAVSGLLGYVLLDHALGPVSIAEPIRMDLGRTLEAVFSAEELRAHSARLEELVAHRTAELEFEVSIRRKAEQELQRANAELESEVGIRRRAEQELQRANAELQRSLALDGLTRIANRTAFESYLDEQWQRHRADGDELALLMVDVDMFKAYNDRYGHLAGDDALRVVASCLERSARYPHDLACRFGGEEFVAVLPHTGWRAALTVAQRFQQLLAEAGIPHDVSTVAPVVTASIGIAVAVPTTSTAPATLITVADRALYRAKEQGRNTTVLGTELGERVPGLG